MTTTSTESELLGGTEHTTTVLIPDNGYQVVFETERTTAYELITALQALPPGALIGPPELNWDAKLGFIAVLTTT